MATGEDIEIQRTIDGEANEVVREATQVVASVSTAFTVGDTFKKVQKSAEKLLNDGLLSLNSLIHATAIEFGDVSANSNLPKKSRFTQKEVATLVNTSLNTGDTLPDTLKTSRQNNVARMSNEMARLNSLGYDTSQIQASIMGTKSAKYKDGFLGATINNEETLSRTSNKMANEVARDANRQKNPDIIGYIWTSTLDGSTSLTCQDLNGKKFYYDKSGAKPVPPAHPNCRSSTEPIIDNGTKNGEVPEVESVNAWIKNNPDEAKQAMGATRYKLYKDGNLKINRYTDAQFEPLTLSKLKKQNEVAFKKAGVELGDSGLPVSTPTPTPPPTPTTPPTQAPKVPTNISTKDSNTLPDTPKPSKATKPTDDFSRSESIEKELDKKIKADQAKSTSLNIKRFGIDDVDEYNKVTTQINQLQSNMENAMWLSSAVRKKNLGNVSDKLLNANVQRKLNAKELKEITTLDGFELVTNRRGFEHAMVIGKDGQTQILKSGNKGSVPFSMSEIASMRGSTLSHNHPSNSPFSSADVQVFSHYGLKEIRAVSDDYVYILNDSKAKLSGQKMRDFISDMANKGKRAQSKAFNEGSDQWEAMYKAQQSVADEYGVFYTREYFNKL